MTHAVGIYRHFLNGQLIGEDKNLLPTEGLNFLLDVSLGATPKATGWFVALFAGAVAPAANWTASNFAAVASEITSTTEGYVSATRPAFTPAASVGGIITNATGRASFVIATAGTLLVQGAAVLSSPTRGGTSGVLISASRYTTARTFAAGDIYDCEYELSLTAA